MKWDVWSCTVAEKQTRIFQILLVPVIRSEADKMFVAGKTFFWWSDSLYKELKELWFIAVHI